MKRLGFLTGALLAAIVVFAFHQWRHVDDDDRLLAVLVDHCLPYVQNGDIPFQTVGRAPGVYDAVEVDAGLKNGGARLIYDLRFIGEWGETEGLYGPARFCSVRPTYGENTVPAFEVDPNGFVSRYSRLMKTFDPLLEPQSETLTNEGPVVFGWYRSDQSEAKGLRVVLTASVGVVSGVTMVKELP